jgi:RNA-dependent RNA polymerase
MEFDVANIAHSVRVIFVQITSYQQNHLHLQATDYAVKKAIAAVLHGPDFYNPMDHKTRPMNFNLVLPESIINGYAHNGRGTLTLPTRREGQKFFQWTKEPDNVIRVEGRKLKFYMTHQRPQRRLEETLQKLPFIDPDIALERERKLSLLKDSIRVLRVQFGTFYQVKGQAGRSFSVEWDHDCRIADVAWLTVHWDNKVCPTHYIAAHSYNHRFI